MLGKKSTSFGCQPYEVHQDMGLFTFYWDQSKKHSSQQSQNNLVNFHKKKKKNITKILPNSNESLDRKQRLLSNLLQNNKTQINASQKAQRNDEKQSNLCPIRFCHRKNNSEIQLNRQQKRQQKKVGRFRKSIKIRSYTIDNPREYISSSIKMALKGLKGNKPTLICEISPSNSIHTQPEQKDQQNIIKIASLQQSQKQLIITPVIKQPLKPKTIFFQNQLKRLRKITLPSKYHTISSHSDIQIRKPPKNTNKQLIIDPFSYLRQKSSRRSNQSKQLIIKSCDRDQKMNTSKFPNFRTVNIEFNQFSKIKTLIKQYFNISSSKVNPFNTNPFIDQLNKE